MIQYTSLWAMDYYIYLFFFFFPHRFYYQKGIFVVSTLSPAEAKNQNFVIPTSKYCV